MSDIFTEPQVSTPEATATPSTLDSLVGEGKKYRTVEDLANGYQNADGHINKLEGEGVQLRSELDKRLNAEDMVDTIKREREELQAARQAPENTTPSLDEDSLSKLISSTLDQRDTQKTAAVNQQIADTKMKELYGDKAGEVFQNKARELGISVEFLGEVAAKSPDAFFNTLGISTQKVQTPTPSVTVGTTNTAAVHNLSTNNVEPGTWESFEAMRRENPRKYFTPKVQNQLFKMRTEKGQDGFYNQ